MTSLIARRLIQAVVALIAVLLVVFVCLLATGDPVEMLVPPDATDADKARIRGAYGLDRPILYQFGAFVWRAAQGDFGRSFFSDRPALGLVFERLPASVELAVASTIIAIGAGVPLGIVAAVRRGTFVDQLVMGVALLGQSVASFWLALMLILLFGVTLQWLPVSGRLESASGGSSAGPSSSRRCSRGPGSGRHSSRRCCGVTTPSSSPASPCSRPCS